ncbi:MAG TPA: MBG domain-containing protein, partial [Verrucomicrobiae bacterium]|nr:MBG domain-containing protein [Verrucomicrobiae bacterium]
SNRLAAAHSVFTNDFVMVTTALNPPTLSFADEQVPQFEVNQYYRAVTFNGLQSVQLKGGYWDQNVRNPGSFLARAGGMHYRDAWNQVDRNTTRRIYIESWNEYDEGTGIYAADTVQPPYVAPGNTSGNTDTWSATGDPFEYIKTTASGAAAFNDVPDQDAIVLWHNLPATLTPGEAREAVIIVRNTGDESWTAAGNFKLGQADADVAFVAGKRVLLDDAQDEIPVYGGIFRGRPKAFAVTLTAPMTPGQYTTHWRMVQDGTGWFGEELEVPIEVKTKSAGTLTFGDVTQVADGTPRSVSVTTIPPGLNVTLTYNDSPFPPTDAGIYIVSGMIDDPDYFGRTASLLIITDDPNLLAGTGGFEDQVLGASVTTPPDVVDGVTIPGWRVFNVDSANASFTASI